MKIIIGTNNVAQIFKWVYKLEILMVIDEHKVDVEDLFGILKIIIIVRTMIAWADLPLQIMKYSRITIFFMEKISKAQAYLFLLEMTIIDVHHAHIIFVFIYERKLAIFAYNALKNIFWCLNNSVLILAIIVNFNLKFIYFSCFV